MHIGAVLFPARQQHLCEWRHTCKRKERVMENTEAHSSLGRVFRRACVVLYVRMRHRCSLRSTAPASRHQRRRTLDQVVFES